jgi:hypothetical protein
MPERDDYAWLMGSLGLPPAEHRGGSPNTLCGLPALAERLARPFFRQRPSSFKRPSTPVRREPFTQNI